MIQIVNNSGSATAVQSERSGGRPSRTSPVPPTVVHVQRCFRRTRRRITGSTALDTVTGQISFVDVNAGDQPTVSVEFNSFTYQNAQQHDVTRR